MRMIFATAGASALATLALVSAMADERPSPIVDTAVHAEGTPAASTTAGRVSVDFTVKSFDLAAAERGATRREAAPAGRAEAAPSLETVALEPARPARTWFPADQSLRRGDIVVRDGDALVYEGVKNGKRHFRTVGLSRLVSKEERERILQSVRR